MEISFAGGAGNYGQTFSPETRVSTRDIEDGPLKPEELAHWPDLKI